MRTVQRRIGVILSWMVLVSASPVDGQDWPQWRGPNRDGKVTGSIAPETWPKELTRKWRVSVGDGVATPALVGDKLHVQGTELASEKLWSNADNSVQFNTPVRREALIFGISTANRLFCINAENGQTVWMAPLGASSGSQASQGRGGRRGGRRGGGSGGYGSIVDAGSVLLALIPSGELTVFEPGGQFKQLARYKVAASGAYAYPVASRNRLYIKDQDSVTLWTIE